MVDANNNNYSTVEESPKNSHNSIDFTLSEENNNAIIMNNTTANEDDDDQPEIYDFNWWNLDSKYSTPVRFVSKEAVYIYLYIYIYIFKYIIIVNNCNILFYIAKIV